jgi:UDP-2,4-diacetamido-2,4,6-trideoxy-beta-L-altropyranose hydrolase
MSVTRRVLIRVDANPFIGSGHLMRMVALAQLLSDHGVVVTFASHGPETGPLIVNGETFARDAIRVGDAAGSPADAAALRSIILRERPDWVVLDGSAFREDYQRAVRECGVKVMSVDDLGGAHFASDVVLNQNFGAESAHYSVEPYTALKLGPAFVMLRREFRNRVRPPARAEPPRRVLVSLGGGTTAGSTALDVIARGLALVDRASLSFRLVVGRLAASSGTLARLSSSDPARFEILPHVQDMAAEIGLSDLAITSGGSTVWELMQSRVPFIAVALNEPQRDFLEMLERDGLTRALGGHDTLTPERVRDTLLQLVDDRPAREGMIARAAGIIDAERASRALLGVFGVPYSNSAT